jgi:hypothetical protein
MSLLIIAIVVGVASAAAIIYQVIKEKKAVTVADVVAQAKTDAATVQADVKKV